jgi:hypothetical protein
MCRRIIHQYSCGHRSDNNYAPCERLCLLLDIKSTIFHHEKQCDSCDSSPQTLVTPQTLSIPQMRVARASRYSCRNDPVINSTEYSIPKPHSATIGSLLPFLDLDACEGCQIRKIQCDNNLPACFPCSTAKSECSRLNHQSAKARTKEDGAAHLKQLERAKEGVRSQGIVSSQALDIQPLDHSSKDDKIFTLQSTSTLTYTTQVSTPVSCHGVVQPDNLTPSRRNPPRSRVDAHENSESEDKDAKDLVSIGRHENIVKAVSNSVSYLFNEDDFGV